MKVFACRHGNTFGPDQQGGERIFMSGCNNNIPLVATGREQARNFAKHLDQRHIMPSALYANHLVRTWEMAVIIREYFLFKYNIEIPLYKDERLLELDYGAWAGLTTQGETAQTNEVIAQFGLDAWQTWQHERKMPVGAPHHWQVSEAEMVNSVTGFFQNLINHHTSDDVIIAIGSQGSLTFINHFLDGGMSAAVEKKRIKIKTGHFCELDYKNNEWNLLRWNQRPD
ncbi:bifunctional RNase H/acid phosphatase [Piscirickettsia salmonis]|uniref:histidine phosphatase family protein n=1 Tax=Piscirickettsia salmonis TaxID=1238 RepID=UPI0012B7BCDA|nr:histidine phosphatase family protein [Piscirickettsia salmonis]QGP51277.1 bifunctional RNase H/acid phosphatase [Piscirickettsia salmonis]QGP53515.1 bifunctional RNase H/acid phosphatase [Piscirickettsia salmonis]QGP60569.1 bifunctional RNase H/acid phosphatase [Piscirickettsia salmonis]QGP63083.1 bifunctional RNase H/acid phosphatase [Piscirickettsia salmonis]